MKSARILLLVSLAGSLFAGYLTYSKVFTNVCPFNEPCSYLWGYPTCLYGLVMFLAILIPSIMMFKEYSRKLMTICLTFSATGTLFAAYFTIQDFSTCPLLQCDYAMMLPTCAYGLLFFIAALVTSIVALKRKNKQG